MRIYFSYSNKDILLHNTDISDSVNISIDVMFIGQLEWVSLYGSLFISTFLMNWPTAQSAALL